MQSNQKIEYYFRWAAAVQWCDGNKREVYYHCSMYPVTKRTKAGVFIDDYGRKRFILNDAKKKWAAPTKQEAWLNYKARSHWALSHAMNNLEKIKFARSSPQFASDTFPLEVVYEVSNPDTNPF